MPLRLYDTLTKRMADLSPRDPARVTFYSCGPTVYDDAHIGNFRSFLAADVLRRWLESPLCELRNPDGSVHRGPRTVVQVMNITDVGHMTEDDIADGGGEDKMEAAVRRLAEAKKAGTHHEGEDVDPSDPFAIARFYEARFREDALSLGLRVALDAQSDPTRMPRATDNVPGMITMIETLIQRGHAYVVGQPGRGTVYFDVRSFPDYGRLSGNTIGAVREGAGGRLSQAHQSSKRHPADFLLWKTDPAHLMKWDSPWGAGYPGWHIECSVMALAGLASGHGAGEIDLHSGGEDNIFPHHECEIAQSRCATGAQRFARHWFHARFLMVQGQKMSKSKGSFHTPRQLFSRGHEPAAVRLQLIKTHYRANANFTEQGLKDSARQVERWRRFVQAGGDPAPADADALAASPVAQEFAAAMHDDLNIAGALGALNKWINSVAKATKGDAAILKALDIVVGTLELPQQDEVPFDWMDRSQGETHQIIVREPLGGETASIAESVGPVYVPEEHLPDILFKGVAPDRKVAEMLAIRAQARAGKNFAESDAIRDQLHTMGYAIKDVAGGRVEVSPAAT
ncbi:MAG: cysteine--tRNA ligase [Planctomycetes bacterium]|nr:cysteine--tRNA ligase [Planctomycetota bacterium]